MKPQLELFAELEPDVCLRNYDWIVVNSSAGKDSLAMLDVVFNHAEAEQCVERIVVVHCDLGRVEWPGTRELAQKQSERYGVRFEAVWRRQGDLLQQIEERGKFPGPATRFCTAHHKQNQVARVFTRLTEEAQEAKRAGDLLSQVEERGMWPSPRQRYCTSDQKRAQVHRLFTALTKTTEKRGDYIRILNCLGMRADESPARAKKSPYFRDQAASNGKRLIDTWLPLHRWTEEDVWERIRTSRAADLVHPAYALGMPRLSCCFCIFAPKAALMLAGKHNPELLAEYVAVEQRIGHRFRLELSLAEVQQALDEGATAETVENWRM